MGLLEKAKATLKSSETDDWLDVKVVRPLAYLWAVAFNKFDIHPNTVTIISMFVGAGSAYFFAQGSYYYCGVMGLVLNIIGITLLLIADILDCTDGQLARMTGKSSRLGRILDGAAGFTWFLPIYLAMVFRFYCHHDIEFSWFGLDPNDMTATIIGTIIVFALGILSGVIGIAGQQRLADYYIQVHLFFLKGEKGSELDNSRKQQQILDEMPKDEKWIYRLFQKNYVNYTKAQEKVTPQFQRLMAKLTEKYGSANNMPAEIREELHAESLGIMPWNGLLTFNFRTTFLIILCLADLPAMYFLAFEIIFMSILYKYINIRHENFCRRVAEKL